MIEFLTEWSWDDPKWLVIFMIWGAFGVWLGYWNHKQERKKPWLSGSLVENLRDNMRTIVFALIFLYGFIEFFRRLIVAIFN
ncbi:hypothetical protein [Allomuricauda sp. d1]|uniref:hypothetical protein n=1 Tax=Allomuricauda sp. d1 TaxID=3136725 RepID=UPI0031D061FD